MLQSLSPRLVFFGLAITALAAMLFARIYLEEILGLAPCPLCMTQRFFVVLWGGIALLAALHNPVGWGRRVYASLCAVAAIGGGAIAVRHVWLQHLRKNDALRRSSELLDVDHAQHDSNSEGMDLDITIGAAKVRVHRARLRLTRVLEKSGGNHEHRNYA